jgi:radical SAM superfamily enzyme YgiQ (UPF0313 family)
MKVSLIFTTNEINTNFKELEFKDDNLGFIPPLTLLVVASILEKNDVEVQVLDMDAERLSYSQTLDRINEFSPDLLGFTLSTYSFHPLLKWIEAFKEDTGIPILAGGMHTDMYADEIMTHQAIDYILLGEAETSVRDFVSAFKNGRNMEGVKSLAYRKNGEVYIDRTVNIIDNIDDVPFPSLHLIKNDLYYNILTKRKNFTAMLSARGCPYRCTFCNQYQTPWRERSPDNLVAEIKYNYENFGIQEIDFYDTTFTANKKRAIAICEAIVRENLDISWTIRTRVDSVNERVLDALKSAGCHTVMYGIESSNREILKMMKKKISIERVEKTLKYTKDVGMDNLGFFMFGYPGETKETIKDTIRFSLDLPLDYAQYTVMVPYPDAEIYNYYRENGLDEDYWREVTLDASKERRLELLGTEVTRDEAGVLLSSAYRQFYYRPRIIGKRLFRLQSVSEFKRLAKGAIGIIQASVQNKSLSHPGRRTNASMPLGGATSFRQ